LGIGTQDEILRFPLALKYELLYGEPEAPTGVTLGTVFNSPCKIQLSSLAKAVEAIENDIIIKTSAIR